jgi:DNA-binding LacI/PurR family transcriptional regulator
MSRSAARQQLLAQLSHIDLTSVSPEPREQANRAVAAVVERLDSARTDAVSSVLQPRLMVRDTTGPAPTPKNASAT